MKIKAWIGALRLRTLIIIWNYCRVSTCLYLWWLGFENFYFSHFNDHFVPGSIESANDLGDAQKGTDNERRIGPERAVQSGVISQYQMKIAVIIVAILRLPPLCF